jgi:non-specific serine/threonine protein kinase
MTQLGLFLTPSGILHIDGGSAKQPILETQTAGALQRAFGASSAEGLLLLATNELEQELPAEFVFWRGFARDFFQHLCHLGEVSLAEWMALKEPGDEALASLVSAAPPMRGLEYLSPERLRSLWRDLRDLAVARAGQHSNGPAAWLQALHPVFHLLGRVTFHLAENKRDAKRPFAFLATYTHGLSSQARLRHLPLAEALKTYAGANEQAKLTALLEPVRRAAEQCPLVRELMESKALFAPQAWTIREAYRFLKESLVIEAAGVVVRLPDWWSPRKPPRPQIHVTLGSWPASGLSLGQLLDFQARLALDGELLTDEERRQLLETTDGLTLLRGKWVEVDRAKIQQALDHWKTLEKEHAQGISFVDGMRLLAGAKLEGGDDAGADVANWSRITGGSWLNETLERMRHPDTIDACQPGRDLRATLRPYQVEGVRWLWFMTELGLGGCLADDMGLGKTIQVIDLLLLRKRQAAAGAGTGNRPARTEASAAVPSLLVVPASLIGNWRQELDRFAPSLKVLCAHPSECSPEELKKVADDPAVALAGFDLVITTYGLARRQAWLEQVHWPLAVLDEAQAIKNAGSAQTRTVKKLPVACRLVLTGTPVENHLGDLWSLFDFCCPGLLGSAAQFKKYVKQLNQRQDAQAFAALRRLVRPYVLRRLKTDPNIVPDLPEKTEMRVECGLSKKQAALYERAVDDFSKRLEDSEGIARRGLVLAMLMHLKQICNHPAQYVPGAAYVHRESGKFERLRLLCEPIAERQEKILVFTQFQSLTAPLADFLVDVFGRPGLVLHGAMPVGKRAELVRAFQDEQGPPFFVISLKAGGSGLNLTAACHVIHFDRWWNPAVENQATDRAFRIGQKRNVLVHKFVCRGTVEERIDAMVQSKQAIADQVLNQDGEANLTKMSDDELMRLVALDIGRATAE